MSVDENVHKSSKLANTHTNDITSATSVNDLSSHPSANKYSGKDTPKPHRRSNRNKSPTNSPGNNLNAHPDSNPVHGEISGIKSEIGSDRISTDFAGSANDSSRHRSPLYEGKDRIEMSGPKYVDKYTSTLGPVYDGIASGGTSNRDPEFPVRKQTVKSVSFEGSYSQPSKRTDKMKAGWNNMAPL